MSLDVSLKLSFKRPIEIIDVINTLRDSGWMYCERAIHQYAAVEHQVRDFLHAHAMRRFDPYRFDAGMTLEFLSMIDQAVEKVREDTLENAVIEAREYQLQDHGLSAQGLIALLISSVVVGLGILNFA